jgi:hypothetical protein
MCNHQTTNINLSNIYKISNSITMREAHGETVAFLMNLWTGNMEDEIFIFNETGKFIVEHMDGEKNLSAIAEDLSSELSASGETISVKEIEFDIINFAEELLKRKIIVKI